MRTTITIDDELLADAQEYTGITDRTELIREALKRMVRREAALRLIALGGTMPDLDYIPQRRQEPE
jgi:Arc/MetJ family transcription regulator